MKLDLDSYSIESKTPTVDGKFIDRELSWLDFNKRVLYYADDQNTPLNERLKFLAISCSNLTEFISVRYSTAIEEQSPVLDAILRGIKDQMKHEWASYWNLKEELKKQGIRISDMKSLSKSEKTEVKKIYERSIFPLLTPVNVGPTNELPIFYSGQTCIAVIAKHGNLENLILIPISKNLDKMYKIGNKVLMVEDIVIENLSNLCVNKEITCVGSFKIIKNANICLNHDTSKFILDRMISTIQKRNAANPLFMVIHNDTPEKLKHILSSVFGISKKNIFEKTKMLDYSRFMKTQLLGDEYSYPAFEAHPFEVVEETHSLFSTLKDKDILLHHPYDSYDTVVKFIEHAAVDSKVVMIKQTLYRVSSEDSPIINALCNAAHRGKSVTVLIEIKARFDEEQNIALIEKLKKAGVHVLLGLEYLKTHCKMCIVVRKEDNDMVIYSHIGTGNYNEKTACQYTDLSYLTRKQKVGMDLLHIFNILSGTSTPDEKLQRVFYAPINLRKRLVKNIDREIEQAKKGKRAEIFLKLNSINDLEMINKLYEAAKKGVQVYVLARGICSIIPTENLYVKSIVGRFLEHSRIYYFYNGGKPEYYISSADLLTRNLDRRVEILLLVNDYLSIKKLKNIINVFKADKKNSFKMDEDGVYKKVIGDFDCQQWFIDKADKKMKPGDAKEKK